MTSIEVNEIAEPRDGDTVTVGTQADDTEISETAEQRDGPTVTVGAQTDDTEMNETEVKHKELAQELLPGIPNDITLALVSQKLPWNAFHALSSVSRPWLQAIQGRLPYHARVRSNSTDTLVLHTELASGPGEVLALYSMRDKRCYQLPAIPDCQEACPRSCDCVAMDGKIYVIGGSMGNDGVKGSAEVYVYDLVGQRQWRRCASMQAPRHWFGCVVLDGKIYVFGGVSVDGEDMSLCEMYDPVEDVWSTIPPMPAARSVTRVVTSGEELVIHPGSWDGIANKWKVEVYHSVQRTWTKSELTTITPLEHPDEELVAMGFLEEVNFTFESELGFEMTMMVCLPRCPGGRWLNTVIIEL